MNNNYLDFTSNAKLIMKEDNKEIQIYPSKSENNGENHITSFSAQYLLKSVISELCDKNIDLSKITTLNMSKCNITDLPDSCKKLNLKHLDLSHNSLEKVPMCLYNGLKSLESLDLSYNRIEDFDVEPDCLLYIKKMKLNNNRFSSIPKWFLMFRCSNMEEFCYSNNRAVHYNFIKNGFSLNLMKLKKLELKNSCLIDSDINFLSCFKELVYLDISNHCLLHLNKFFNLDNLFINQNWQRLNVLKVNDLRISILPVGITRIESLKELHATDNSLSWLPDDIQQLVNLEILNVSRNVLVYLPKGIESLKKLRVLIASTNSIETAPDFSKMDCLKTLDLFDNLLDTVSFNVNTIDFIDLENNYCDTSEFEHYCSYEEKRNGLRKKYFIEGRSNGYKTKQDDCTDYSSDSDTSYSSQIENVSTTSFCLDDTENWDLSPVPNKLHPDIDSDDDNWKGEETLVAVIKNCTVQKNYACDDEWKFEDCDD